MIFVMVRIVCRLPPQKLVRKDSSSWAPARMFAKSMNPEIERQGFLTCAELPTFNWRRAREASPDAERIESPGRASEIRACPSHELCRSRPI